MADNPWKNRNFAESFRFKVKRSRLQNRETS